MSKQLTLADRFYIEKNKDLPLALLVTNTGKTEKVIKGFLQTLTEAQTKQASTLQKTLAINKSGFGVAIMSQGGSEMSDEASKKYRKAKHREDIVFKPSG